MSQIFRQSLKSSIYSYAGVIIGFLNTSIILPRVLSTTELGIIGLIKSFGMILTSLFSFGFPVAIVRLFPRFKDEINRNNGFGTVLMLIAFVSSILLTLSFPLAEWIIESKTQDNAPQFVEYIAYILPFSAVGIFFIFLEYYGNALKKSTLGSFYKDLVQRLFILASIGIYLFFSLSFNHFLQLYIASIAGATLLIFGHLSSQKSFTFKIDWKRVRAHTKEAASVASYGLATNIGSILVISIDSIMIAFYWPSSEVGIYTTVFFFASLMLVPSKALSKIGNTFIAENFNKNDLKGVESIYMKSCLNQGVVGMFMFFNLIILLPFVFVILKEEFEPGKWVIFFIGLSNLFKMMTGLNFQVINFSKFYRFNTLFILFYLLIMVSLNALLIPIIGITGAAIASAISSLLYSYSGTFFLYKKLNMPFFEKKFLKPALTLASVGTVFFLISFNQWNWKFSLVLAALFSLSTATIIYTKNFAPDLIEQANKFLKKK